MTREAHGWRSSARRAERIRSRTAVFQSGVGRAAGRSRRRPRRSCRRASPPCWRRACRAPSGRRRAPARRWRMLSDVDARPGPPAPRRPRRTRSRLRGSRRGRLDSSPSTLARSFTLTSVRRTPSVRRQRCTAYTTEPDREEDHDEGDRAGPVRLGRRARARRRPRPGGRPTTTSWSAVRAAGVRPRRVARHGAASRTSPGRCSGSGRRRSASAAGTSPAASRPSARR